MKSCVQCGASLPEKAPGGSYAKRKDTRCCSAKCSNADYYSRNKEEIKRQRIAAKSRPVPAVAPPAAQTLQEGVLE